MRPRCAVTVLLVGAIAIAYGGSLANGFVFDDALFVRDEPRLRSLGAAPRLFVEPVWGYLDEKGVSRLDQHYRPLQTLALALLRALFPGHAWPAHLLSVALHAANVLLLWSILAALLGSSGLASALALLYAVHPGYSEAVLWASNLAGLGAAFCILAVYRLHLSASASRWPVLASMGVLYLCGLLFHEIALLAPVLIAAHELIAGQPRAWRRLAAESTVFAPALLSYLALRRAALGGLAPGLGASGLGASELAVNAVGLLPQFAAAFVWPFELNMYHDFTPLYDWRSGRFAAGAGLLLAAAAGFALSARRRPLVAVGIVWTLVATAPYLVVRWPESNVFAERYLYLPAVGVFLCAGALVAGDRAGLRGPGSEMRSSAARRVRAFRHFPALIAVAALAVTGVLTIRKRVPDWRDDVTLYTRTLTQSERAVSIRNNLAVRLLELGRHGEGIEVLEKVVDLGLATSETMHNLGLLRAAGGDERGALEAFRAAGRYGQLKSATLLNLGYMYERVGERGRAVETYMRLLDRAPDYVPAWFNLAAIAFESGQFDNASRAVTTVLEHSADHAEAQLLDARLRRLASLKRPSLPADRAATRRSCKRASALARRGRYREAAVILRAAAWLDERAPLPHQHLANVAALRGDWHEALAAARSALERAPHSKLYRRNVEALEKRVREATQLPSPHG